MRISFNKGELSALKLETVRGRPFADRMSTGLVLRLIGMHDHRCDYFAVLDELEHLEGLRQESRTKPESQIRRAPLHPLWHKHFSSAQHPKQLEPAKME